MLTAFESIIGRRRGGDGRRGPIVLAAALAVFFAALVFSLSSAYGAPKTNPPPEKATKKTGYDSDVSDKEWAFCAP